LPNNLFEYMAAGLAILANNLPEIAAVVQEHQLGVIYEDKGPAVLAQAIEQLISDRKGLEGCRQRAWQVYHEHYTWQRHQQVLLTVYEGLRAS
jgi:glycosyltransferase involved in cell wall biosynthesis